MFMAVMRLGEMRMAVHQWLVLVQMIVPRAGRHRHCVLVVVMRVALAMAVLVGVFYRSVHVTMFVALGQMQCHADGHQRAGGPQRRVGCFAQ